ncbi:MAG: hypothetical protein J6K24_00875 [Tidjanibacter sp.]|nr:hypothetical protein [Tidjanibacter sp.]
MKTILNYLLIIIASLVLCGCDNKNDYKAIDERFNIESLQNGIYLSHSINMTPSDCMDCIFVRLSVVHTYDLNEWWNKISPIRKKMDSVIKTNGNFYIYTSLKNISVVANQPIEGREVGEEIADLFEVKETSYIFTYPDGDLVYAEGQRTHYSIDEWCNSGYMLPKSWALVPKFEIPSGLMLDISVTITTEDGDMIIRSDDSFSLDSSVK